MGTAWASLPHWWCGWVGGCAGASAHPPHWRQPAPAAECLDVEASYLAAKRPVRIISLERVTRAWDGWGPQPGTWDLSDVTFGAEAFPGKEPLVFYLAHGHYSLLLPLQEGERRRGGVGRAGVLGGPGVYLVNCEPADPSRPPRRVSRPGPGASAGSAAEPGGGGAAAAAWGGAAAAAAAAAAAGAGHGAMLEAAGGRGHTAVGGGSVRCLGARGGGAQRAGQVGV